MSVILMPTLNPNEKILQYISELKNKGFKSLIIVNDGSDEYVEDILRKVLELKDEQFDIIILRHAVNLGKGRAIKNGINFYLTHLNDRYKGCHGLITVDSDGQHLVKDVLKIDELIEHKHWVGVILGCRDFNQKNVPFKSKYGNKITKIVFRVLYGTCISDTQTGLRGFSNETLYKLINLYGERFEYETNVLIECIDKKIPIKETVIQTVYEDDNHGTHFNPVIDSIKIYYLLLARFLRYILSSFSASLLDLFFFTIICRVVPLEIGTRIYIATFGARVVSSVYNYLVNKNIVFRYKKESVRTAIQYFLLCIIIMLISGFWVNSLYSILGGYELIIKCIVDTVLFLCNYFIQQKFIFRYGGREGCN